MPVQLVKVKFADRVRNAIKAYNYNFNRNPIDPMLGPSFTAPDGVGFYLTYADQVNAAYRKYLGQDKFGCAYTKAVVDFRTSYIAGNGAVVQAEDPKSDEQKFVDGLISRSKLDGGFLTDIIRYSELEGKALLILKRIENDVVIRHVPWLSTTYKIETDANDYEQITGVKIQQKEVITPDKFTYVKLGGVRHEPNLATNKLHLILGDLENIDRALNDWGLYNNLYGLGYPYWETQTWDDAVDLATQITAQDWRPGKSLAAPAKNYYVEPTGNGRESILDEIKTRVKKASGLSGIPPHFFGFTDLLSNRSTAESMLEQISTGTTDERNTFQEKIWEIIEKAMVYHNAINNTKLDPSKITVQLPVSTQEQIRLLNEVYVPMSQLGFVSKNTVQNMVPGVDPIKEREQIARESSTQTTKEVVNENIN
jgi:hypothetical protein